MPTYDALHWRSLSTVVDERKTQPTFFKSFFSREETKPAETEEVHYRKSHLKTVPFVGTHQGAIPVSGREWDYDEITFPNIKVKNTFTPNQMLTKRLMGTKLFVGKDEMSRAIKASIQNDLDQTVSDIDTTKEWMSAKVFVDGALTVQQDDAANFTATLPRASALTYTAAALWDGAGKPFTDVKAVKRLMMTHGNCQPSDCVLGADAADVFQQHASLKDDLKTDNLEAGGLTLNTNYSDMGLMYLGKVYGIRFWEYSSQITHEGAAVDLVPAKKAIFIHTGSRAQNRMLYGPIPDMTLMQSGNWQRKNFTKSWRTEDPSSITYMNWTRPFPWMKYPNTVAVVTVVS